MDTPHMQERETVTRRSTEGSDQKADLARTTSKPAVSVCDDLQVLIAKRAHQLYDMRGCRDGHAFDDWLEAEREILSQVPPVSSAKE